MTEHAVMFKRTEVIYVYDSDDEKIKKRRERRKKIAEKKKATRLRVRNRCDACGFIIQNNSYIKLDHNTFICLSCAIEVSSI
jgi:predicted Zn-ribbon and HTH transcriptional regulator